MPWHLGGPDALTYDEIGVFTDALKQTNDARRKANRQQQSRRRTR